MAVLESLVSSGRIVDLMLVFVALEVVAILLYRARRGGGVPPWPLLANVGAGGSLMLALRAGLGGAGWTLVALCLVSALAFHVLDLALRWERPAGTQGL